MASNNFSREMQTGSNNTILVEKHYIPADMYMQIYGNNAATRNTNTSYWENISIPRQSNVMPTRTNNDMSSSSRYNDLISFFNMQSRNTDPLQSRVISRTYETTSNNVNDQSFINMLMTAFYTPELLNNNTVRNQTMSGGDTIRITPAQIDANSRVITYSATVDLDSPSCSICAQEWQHRDKIRKLNSCRHYFHKACVDTWFREHNTCPLCRTNVLLSAQNGIDDVD